MAPNYISGSVQKREGRNTQKSQIPGFERARLQPSRKAGKISAALQAAEKLCL
jgi:hypothetical protein